MSISFDYEQYVSRREEGANTLALYERLFDELTESERDALHEGSVLLRFEAERIRGVALIPKVPR